MTDELPPLPEPCDYIYRVVGDDTALFTADQMRAYAAAAVAKEREKIMAELRQALQDDSNSAAIRRG